MDLNFSQREIEIFNHLKKSICIYVHKPLVCYREDILLLTKEIDKLITSNNYKNSVWYEKISHHLKLNLKEEINYMIIYIQNNTKYHNQHFLPQLED
jgi:hypothetical protein